MKYLIKMITAICLLLIIETSFGYAQNYDTVQIRSIKITDNVYMLTGAGGNMGYCAGDDGGFLVDGEFAPLTEKIKSAAMAINPKPIRYLFNTHVHGDHVGGNENFAKSGTVIVAHDNIRSRMSTDQFIELFNRKVPAYPPLALPTITYSDEMTFHMNGEDVHIIHMPNAHTDGDGIVHFVKANVINTGDLFFNGIYPIIDLSSGGSIDGMIAAVDKILSITNNTTNIIPGHGPLTNPDRLREYRTMLAGVKDHVQALIKDGKSLGETIAAHPSKDYDSGWGNGFMKPDKFVEIVYKSLTKK
ncbi:MAG: MBL fold metallo-hydrolase [Bacteroidota bacterium]